LRVGEFPQAEMREFPAVAAFLDAAYRDLTIFYILCLVQLPQLRL